MENPTNNLATNKDRESNLERKIAKIPDDDPIKHIVAGFYTNHLDEKIKMENDPEWAKDNLEYDLRSSVYIVEKCKNEAYAQNIYAALCNNSFQKNEIIPILMENNWSCTWRYAGGIVADLRGEGDYMNWYCSGIKGELCDDKDNGFVPEGTVTDEIKEDLFNLGWIVVDPI